MKLFLPLMLAGHAVASDGSATESELRRRAAGNPVIGSVKAVGLDAGLCDWLGNPPDCEDNFSLTARMWLVWETDFG